MGLVETVSLWHVGDKPHNNGCYQTIIKRRRDDKYAVFMMLYKDGIWDGLDDLGAVVAWAKKPDVEEILND